MSLEKTKINSVLLEPNNKNTNNKGDNMCTAEDKGPSEVKAELVKIEETEIEPCGLMDELSEDSLPSSLMSDVSSEHLMPQVQIEEELDDSSSAISCTDASRPKFELQPFAFGGLTKGTTDQGVNTDAIPPVMPITGLVVSPTKTYPCPYCSFLGRYRTDLREHLKTHDEHPYKCDVCGNVCSNKGNLSRHMLIHTGVRPYKCLQCDRSFKTSTNLKVHSYKHTGERPFKCDQCPAAFTQRTHLQKHYGTHVAKEPFNCLHCDYHSNVRKEFREHLLLHTGEHRYQCAECDYGTETHAHLQQHMYKHTDERPFDCCLCGARFKSVETLRRHAATVHFTGTKFQCPHCDFVSYKELQMKTHVLSHSDEIAEDSVSDSNSGSKECSDTQETESSGGKMPTIRRNDFFHPYSLPV